MKGEREMKKLIAAVACIAAFVAAAPAASNAATAIPANAVKVAATQANAATDFASDVGALCIYNAGANEAFYKFGAAAVATAGVNEIPPGATWCWDQISFATVSATTGSLAAVVGIICSAGETSTVYLVPGTR